MASVAEETRRTTPRYGSPADLASYAGVSVKTIRRLVDAGQVRGFKVGRRVVIPYADMDAHLLRIEDHPRRPAIMQATPSPTLTTPLVPPLAPEELARRNRAAMALLDEWAADVEGEQDQRETMEVLRRALGPGRIASSRPAIS